MCTKIWQFLTEGITSRGKSTHDPRTLLESLLSKGKSLTFTVLTFCTLLCVVVQSLEEVWVHFIRITTHSWLKLQGFHSLSGRTYVEDYLID